MKPAFADPASARLWDDYFGEVDRLLADAAPDAAEIRNDLQMHVLDSLAAQSAAESEFARLQAALRRLGEPRVYLRALLADGLLERGTRTYRPMLIARGLFHSLLAGSARAATAAAFALGYLLLALFAAMAVLKPLWGDHVGLFRRPDGALSLGIIAHTEGARDLLGLWSTPAALLVSLLLYFALARALRAARAKR